MKVLLANKQKSDNFDCLIDGDKIKNTEQLANEFNKYFNEVSDNLPSSTGNYINEMGTLNDVKSKFEFSEITVDFVLKELQSIVCSKSTGVDGMHPKLLKIASDVIAKPLTNIFNKSLNIHQIYQYNLIQQK